MITASRMRVNTSMDTQARTASRDLIIEEIVARTGIGKAMIERLVRAFCGRVRLDPFIGSIFESKVHDWEAHIARICAFGHLSR
jgi:hemoglobin